MKAKLYVVFWIFMFIVSAGVIVIQTDKYFAQEAERKNILLQIEREKEVERELYDQRNYYQSNAYIEKIAREQLGLVLQNEIIFQNDER